MNKHQLRAAVLAKLTGFLAAVLLAAAPAAVSADVQSSGASNTNETSVSVDMQSDGSGNTTAHVGSAAPASDIQSTGPDSRISDTNNVSEDTAVTNTNYISVNNDNDQKAKTGNCKVVKNTWGGDATCGAAAQAAVVTPPAVEEENVPEQQQPSQSPQVLSAVTSTPAAPVGGMGAGEELVNTGANTIPNMLIGLALLGTLVGTTYLTTSKRRYMMLHSHTKATPQSARL